MFIIDYYKIQAASEKPLKVSNIGRNANIQ